MPSWGETKKYTYAPPFVASGHSELNEVVCPYCEKSAELVDSKEIYGTSYGMAWLCRPCDAYVGCHKSSLYHKPLGRLANKELRAAKQAAHAAFDPLWKRKIEKEQCSKTKARKAGYQWLADQMGLTTKECHIGNFDVDQCLQVVNICEQVRSRG